jgi:DNA-binding NtrC family response regulator
VERAAVVTDGEVLTLASLPPPVRPAGVGLVAGVASEQWDAPGSVSLDDKMAQLERAFVVEALSRTGGVQAAAARLLGITERSIWHLVKKHRIEVEKIKERAQG